MVSFLLEKKKLHKAEFMVREKKQQKTYTFK